MKKKKQNNNNNNKTGNYIKIMAKNNRKNNFRRM